MKILANLILLDNVESILKVDVNTLGVFAWCIVKKGWKYCSITKAYILKNK